MAEYVKQIKDTPKQPGVEEIRIPSERAYRERERRRKKEILVDGKVVESLKIIAEGGTININKIKHLTFYVWRMAFGAMSRSTLVTLI